VVPLAATWATPTPVVRTALVHAVPVQAIVQPVAVPLALVAKNIWGTLMVMTPLMGMGLTGLKTMVTTPEVAVPPILSALTKVRAVPTVTTPPSAGTSPHLGVASRVVDTQSFPA